ncbi:hypothetical protein [Hyphomicrobium sp.]|uniref:hypothetical protein n=1 Tax=Hyphomicrobium sp. TaxID=82 RepID=UPI000FAF9A38|nr:hypothetical protein [Hyphomicrobium sp.]RUO99361.1 MAG: hypothetical protein EKK30_05480 [Hyphomicrobium sp.]
MKNVFAVLAFATIGALPAEAGELYIISRCAPIQVLTGFKTDLFESSSPVFVDGKLVGNLKICDALRASVGAGNHNLRVKLAGKSDYGVSSDAGIRVPTGSGTVYVVMGDNSFTWADVVNGEDGRQFLANVRQANGK